MKLFKSTYDMICQGDIKLLYMYLVDGEITDIIYYNQEELWFGKAIILSDNPLLLEQALKFEKIFRVTNLLDQTMSHLICLHNKQNSLIMMQTLFNNIYDIDSKDKTSRTPLSYALDNENLKMIKLLLSYGCNINNIREFSTNESLIFLKKLVQLDTLTSVQEEIIYLLIKFGADFHRYNFWNESADKYFIILQQTNKISNYTINLIRNLEI